MGSVTYPHQIIHIMTLIPADSFLPILSNFRNITVKDSTKLGKFCLEHGGHQEKTTGTKKQQQVQRKQEIQKNNRYKLLIIGKSWDSAFDEISGFAKEDEDDDNHSDNKSDNNDDESDDEDDDKGAEERRKQRERSQMEALEERKKKAEEVVIASSRSSSWHHHGCSHYHLLSS